MDEQRYHEILPAAYMTAALMKGGRPSRFEVGMCARAIDDAEDTRSPAYRIAMAVAIPCEIVSVTRETTNFGVDKFHIVYRKLSKDHEQEEINTPLLNDFRFGSMTEKIWNRYDENGVNLWVGKRMMLYKHNDPPREGDRSSAGYRCAVYAEPLDQ